MPRTVLAMRGVGFIGDVPPGGSPPPTTPTSAPIETTPAPLTATEKLAKQYQQDPVGFTRSIVTKSMIVGAIVGGLVVGTGFGVVLLLQRGRRARSNPARRNPRRRGRR